MALQPLALLGHLECEGRVRSERDGEGQLLVGRAEAVEGLAERHDPEDLAVRALEPDEELVVRVPGLRRVVERLAGGDEPCAHVL